jgi:hypothetical protein
MAEEKHQMRSDSRTGFTLEDFVRMSFHPKGIRGFMEGVNYELELGPIQSSINKGLGITWDVTKYVLYAVAIGGVAYKIF